VNDLENIMFILEAQQPPTAEQLQSHRSFIGMKAW